MTSNEEKAIDDLVGVVLRPKATGGHQVDRSKIAAPLEGIKEGMVIRVFCEGCGTMVETTQMCANTLAGMAKIELPVELNGLYFETSGCLLCSEKFIDVCLKKI